LHNAPHFNKHVSCNQAMAVWPLQPVEKM
jgi:hypothetical protein